MRGETSRARDRAIVRRMLAWMLLASGMSVSLAANAQIDPTIGSDMLSATLQTMNSYNTQQTTIDDTRTHDRDVYLRRSEGRVDSTATGSAQSGQFGIGNDPEASAQARRRFIDSIRRNSGEQVARLIDADFSRRGVREAFREVVGRSGLRSDDYADVFAAWVVTLWMVANRAPEPDVGRVRSVSAQTHRMFDGSASLGDARERQIAGETMMYELVAATFGKREAERVGDSATLDRMANLARRKFLHSDMDLTRMVLTDAGLVRR